ncbi:hypothetical protein V5O48_005164 [Marasmius crinis-equi]|uniref:Uncharacterized protein n=1 Tax=Marasmius crinis-equi TaxID=585013 RepID=A0ABR3FN28_9AGAR
MKTNFIVFIAALAASAIASPTLAPVEVVERQETCLKPSIILPTTTPFGVAATPSLLLLDAAAQSVLVSPSSIWDGFALKLSSRSCLTHFMPSIPEPFAVESASLDSPITPPFPSFPSTLSLTIPSIIISGPTGSAASAPPLAPILGGVLGGVGIIITAGIFLVIFRRRRRAHNEKYAIIALTIPPVEPLPPNLRHHPTQEKIRQVASRRSHNEDHSHDARHPAPQAEVPAEEPPIPNNRTATPAQGNASGGDAGTV